MRFRPGRPADDAVPVGPDDDDAIAVRTESEGSTEFQGSTDGFDHGTEDGVNGRRLLEDIARLDGFFRTMNSDYSSRLLELESVVADLRRRVSQLERGQGAGGPGTIRSSTVLHDEYREIAARVEAMLDQYVMHLAALAAASAGGTLSLVAQHARSICDALFATPVVEVNDVLRLVSHVGRIEDRDVMVAQTLAHDVERLREAARAKGLDHQWSFDASFDVPVDETTQKVFGSCDPAGLVRLVVFPAFLVEGAVFVRQRVYTGRRQ